MKHPWWVLFGAGLVAAVAFPGTPAGGVGVTIVLAAVGVSIVAGWPRVPAWISRPSPRAAAWLAYATVTVAAIVLFSRVLTHGIGYPGGDWGPQHAALRGVVDHMRSLELPHWNQRLATGDSPIEVYPALTYVITAAIAIAFGLTDHLAAVMFGVALVVHLALALAITRLALRLASPLIAAVIGVLLVADLGAVSSGGVASTIQFGLIHTAVGQLFTILALTAVIDSLRRPQLSTSVAIWIFTALATAAHPSALLSMAAIGAALVMVALLARDAPVHRSLAALGHVAIGAAIGAVVWLPAGDRILMYGQHFSDTLLDPGQWLGHLLEQPVPEGNFAAVVFAGYAGILGALWSRRAAPIVIATCAIVLVIALCDTPYLAFGFAPSQTVARLGANRFYALSRPFIFVGAAYLGTFLLAHVAAAWRRSDRRSQLIAGAIAGVLAGFGGRAMLAAGHLQKDHVTASAHYGAMTHEPLVDWAREQLAALPPGQVARAIFEGHASYLHVTAETGLPAFHLGPIPDVLLRDRIEDASPASLHRFDVRWVIAEGGPPSLGDPATQRKFEQFYIRDIPNWDGQLARIERGTGTVAVTRFDDDAVDVELHGDAPALVALGIGYYPRWRAVDDQGHAVPVYAYPSIEGGKLHILAAWLRPGRTRFTPDGPLPSDRAGLPFGVLGLASAVAILIVWRRPRRRVRVLRRIARGLAWLRTGALLRPVLIAASLALLAVGVIEQRAPARAIEVGTGLRSQAKVRARRLGAEWETCGYDSIAGEYRCPGLITVLDTTATLLNDAQPTWPFTTPAIALRTSINREIEVEITMERRLAGRYWLAASHPAQLAIAGRPAVPLTAETTMIDVPDDGDRAVTLTATTPGGGLDLSIVREDTVEPTRDYPVAPATP